jgi:predicted MPP superfamily phosphohydrolase
VLLVIVTIIAGYSLWSAQRPAVEVINVTVPDSAPADVRGTSIAQITDLHIGSRGGGFLRRVVNRLNRLDADYVMITGDLVDFNGISSAELAPLADLTAPAYFCIGNHERYDDLEDICTRLDGHGVTVLRNRSVLAGGLQFVGVDDADARSQVRTTLATLTAAPGVYRVLLYHRPDGAEDAADWGAHLMLCGHTHNGQMFPFNYLVRRMYPRIRGRFDIGDMTLYVSRGTGTWGPVMRLGSRPEISMIQLH